jgi:hypothetical protein
MAGPVTLIYHRHAYAKQKVLGVTTNRFAGGGTCIV